MTSMQYYNYSPVSIAFRSDKIWKDTFSRCCLSHRMKKNCIGETKPQISCGATTFVFATRIDSSSTYIQSFQLLVLCCHCTAWFVSDLIGNPNTIGHGHPRVKIWIYVVQLLSIATAAILVM